ncbi:hypothetical protein AVEN_220814-1 [Araneus ventricosus]|uniref:Uncharacterized protein n=1 Tax=Araneus ventricosus TaxID=182803 RepID=A0A4Y2FQ52_ARAVE|nr:hypothetical protein AVEN_220814-1 [Araneus ventricosus]
MVSQNSTYKLGGEVENIDRNHNHIRKHSRKWTGGAVRTSPRSARACSSLQMQTDAVNMNRFTNSNLADILFMYDLTNTNGRLLYNYIGKNFLPDTYHIPKCSLMRIRTYPNMDSLQ